MKISVARREIHYREQDQGATFWQKRYYDHNVRDSGSFVAKLRYIHRNPVKRGLVEKPEDWTWSSFRHYLTAEPGRGNRVSLDSRSPDRKNSKTIATSKRLNANQRPHIC